MQGAHVDAFFACVCVCVCVRGRGLEPGERQRKDRRQSEGRHCGLSSSYCGIPSAYPSTSRPNKEAWNTLWLPWEETRARSALWLTMTSSRTLYHMLVLEVPKRKWNVPETRMHLLEPYLYLHFRVHNAFFCCWCCFAKLLQTSQRQNKVSPSRDIM